MTSNYDREIPAKGNRGGSGSAGLNGASRSSGARGRIASVLAQARASLKEPSRPYTPNSLDQRTALDSAFDNGFNNYNSNSNSNSKNGSRSVANSRVADAKQYDKVFQFLNNKKSLAGDTSESSSSGKERKIAQLLSQSQPLSNFSNCEDSNLDSDVSLSLNYNSEYSTFQLIIRDTEDIINILDYEIIGFVNSYSTDRIQDALDSLADPLSRINQRLRTDSKMSEYGK